jgi:hypothetical protein
MWWLSAWSKGTLRAVVIVAGKNLAACISAIKGQLFGHTSALFSSDALHQTHKDAINRVSMTKNCLLF